jgi:hypothetical protein
VPGSWHVLKPQMSNTLSCQDKRILGAASEQKSGGFFLLKFAGASREGSPILFPLLGPFRLGAHESCLGVIKNYIQNVHRTRCYGISQNYCHVRAIQTPCLPDACVRAQAFSCIAFTFPVMRASFFVFLLRYLC